MVGKEAALHPSAVAKAAMMEQRGERLAGEASHKLQGLAHSASTALHGS